MCEVVFVGLGLSGLEVSVELVGVCDEGDADWIWRRRTAMLEREHQTAAPADEIRRGVRPGMEVGAAPQGLSELSAGALTHVVDDGDRDGVLTLELAQQAEQTRDICGAVFIDAMHAHERVQEQQRGSELLQGRSKPALIIHEIEPDARCRDDVQVELSNVETAMTTQTLDTTPDLVERIFCQVDECGAFARDLESTEASGARRDASQGQAILCTVTKSRNLHLSH